MDRKELSEDVQDINARLTHLEDTTLDIREIMVKLVKQGNQIVKVIQSFEIEDVTNEHTNKPLKEDNKKIKEMKELIDEYLSKHHDLVEFEKEMSKHKDKLTPGIVGES